jgi:hypothetical protein
MRTRIARLSRAVSLSGAVIALCAADPVLAGSACKGLEEAACKGMADCTWIDGYTRKDAKKISGYCKAIGKRGGVKGQPTPPADSAGAKAAGQPVPGSSLPAKVAPQ